MDELMKEQTNIDMHLENLKDYVERIISSYCPYVEDRTDLIDNHDSKDFKIRISCNEKETTLLFLSELDISNKPTYLGKTMGSVSEKGVLDHPITFNELTSIIDFVKEDHNYLDVFKFYEMEDSLYPYRIDMIYKVSWPDFEGKKLYCRDIGIEMSFMNVDRAYDYDKQLKKKYNTEFAYRYTNKND